MLRKRIRSQERNSEDSSGTPNSDEPAAKRIKLEHSPVPLKPAPALPTTTTPTLPEKTSQPTPTATQTNPTQASSSSNNNNAFGKLPGNVAKSMVLGSFPYTFMQPLPSKTATSTTMQQQTTPNTTSTTTTPMMMPMGAANSTSSVNNQLFKKLPLAFTFPEAPKDAMASNIPPIPAPADSVPLSKDDLLQFFGSIVASKGSSRYLKWCNAIGSMSLRVGGDKFSMQIGKDQAKILVRQAFTAPPAEGDMMSIRRDVKEAENDVMAAKKIPKEQRKQGFLFLIEAENENAPLMYIPICGTIAQFALDVTPNSQLKTTLEYRPLMGNTATPAPIPAPLEEKRDEPPMEPETITKSISIPASKLNVTPLTGSQAPSNGNIKVYVCILIFYIFLAKLLSRASNQKRRNYQCHHE